MPQMAPLNWLILFMFFSLIFLMFSSLNFYSFFYSIKSTKMIKPKLNYSWKW